MSVGYRVTAWVLAAVICVFFALPIYGMVAGWFEATASSDTTSWQIWKNPRSWELFLKTLWVAVIVAAITTFVGWFTAYCLEAFSFKWRAVILAFMVAAYLLSPYIVVQSLIGLLGTNGSLWQFIPNMGFDLYSTTGLVVLEVLWLFPLSVTICVVGSSFFPAKVADEVRIYRFKGWRWFQCYAWPKYRWSVFLSFCMISILAFWNYEIPSMLRQNMYPIEIMAAFGSFYDYRQAVSLVLVPLVGALFVFLPWMVLSFKVRAEWTTRRIQAIHSTTRRWLLIIIGIVFALIVWGVPLFSLLEQISGWSVFKENFVSFKNDIWNTLQNGLIVALLASLFAFFLALVCRISSSVHLERAIWAMAILVWVIPSSLWGMGFVHLFGLPAFAFVRQMKAELMMVELYAALPLAIVLLGLLSQQWTLRQSEELEQYHTPLGQRLRLFWCQFWPNLIGIQIFTFVLAIREVPASLLNVPPGGATLALTIETLLHFEQPERVASLCLFQLTISLFAVLILIAFVLIVTSRFRWHSHPASNLQ
ncbi:hypothetical protein [Rubellicoccus peritrichatus]|uniref:ABC transmembrane type-1 domain-containing protein n=1 Tax=Rubellicoccus peritrichatus TaxID=3080537 RepID=A0AAQ3QWS3_9BACT|nr:hypothetical protein [Puniceicoccus sp. CR14]WOO43038.1 hypothetical protein RZN69_08025 [Puniceicoccus sp. CR14]